MSGPKAYTMREMKGIVEYLVEHKAYGEYRGRKMWVDFANTSKTNRTWQSLKETFLKRILPDIQNPYYHLTREQVWSFKQGTDVQAKEKNKLEIQIVGEKSSNNENKKDNEEPSASAEKRNEAETLGENIKSATITARNRSSADTFILDDPEASKKTTEELLAELEDPTTSMKDCLNFESEPTSIIRKVIEDFRTDSEASEGPQMEIVDGITVNENTDDVISVNQEVIVVEDSENLDNVEYIAEERIIVEGGIEVDIGPTFDHEIITEVSSTVYPGLNKWLENCDQHEQAIHAEAIESCEVGDVKKITVQPDRDTDRDKSHEVTEPILIEDSANLTENPKERVNRISLDNNTNDQTSLSTTTDTVIPNNQEVLNSPKSPKANSKFDILAPMKEAASRKRSTSQDKALRKKKKLGNGEEKTNGDAVEKTPPSSGNTEALFEALKKADNPIEDGTMQNAQKMDESPQNKNPCLKSVSLFDEQFNTTKYSDSDEETPIPNNREKIVDRTNAATSSDKKEKGANVDSLAEKKKNTTKIDAAVNQKQDKTKIDLKKNEEPAKVGPAIVKKLNGTAKVNPPVEKKREIAKDSCVEKKYEEPTKVDAVDKNPETVKVNLQLKKKPNTIVLRSNSESDETTPPAERPKERYKHLAQAFGFVPGTSVTAAQRRRSLRSRNRTKSQRNSCTHPDASDWEGSVSEPELADEYISPPRGRRNRHARKYRKPQAARMMSLDEDGALFVIHGNKVIPLVKNGRNLTFVTYDTLGYSEEEEDSIWRQKYIDEKKKAAQLKRQLEEATEANVSRSKSPILQNSTRNTPSTSAANCKTVQNPTEINMNKHMNIKQIGDSEKIQISLSKNNEETINLEGHWSQLQPIVQQLMSIFYEESAVARKPDDKPVDISGLETPVIPVIDLSTRQVDDLEGQIFKEIEEHDKKEKTLSNVTKRKAGRPKKTRSTSSEQSEKPENIVKRTRKSKSTVTKDKPETTNTNDAIPESKPQSDDKMAEIIEPAAKKNERRTSVVLSVSDRLSVESLITTTSKKGTPPVKDKPTKRKVTEDKTDNIMMAVTDKMADKSKMAAEDETDNESVKTVGLEPRVTRARKSGNETDSSTRTVTTRLSLKPKHNAEDDIRYMLPPDPKTRRANRASLNKARSPEHEVSQDRFENTIDSTQGYQDSNPSPVAPKRKRKLSVTVRKGKHIPRRKSLPNLPSVHDMSVDSNNSSYFIPKQSKSHSTLDSAIYKTESYQILMENKVQKLDAIEESSKDDDSGHFNAVSNINSSNIIDIGSSSNVSLPLSPELSVVENLSISREMIRCENYPTINEMQANDCVVNNIYNQYLISDVDVSVPLMQQNCELLITPGNGNSQNKQRKKPPIKVSELLNKVCTVNMSLNNTLSNSLDIKLRDLLLESAKKITDTNKEKMDVDESIVESNKTKRKRSSTPRKKNTRKPKPKVAIDPVIEEHMESCSYGGRKSCPPVITFVPIDENANNSADVNLAAKPKPATIKAKKDVIKVKIQRPKKINDVPITVNESGISVYTDSGINETTSISGVFLQGNDSVELIHNHSETCLQANECIMNSIEFVENSRSESVISINSTASLDRQLLEVMGDVELLTDYNRKKQNESGEKSSGEIFGTPAETVYHSPVASNCSIITEDLSDEAPLPPTKWYLLSEDDTNNTNMRPELMTSNIRVSNYSASLKQLFPITCAVPDLSTISELSKENEGSKASGTDCDTQSSDYQSLL